MFLKFWFRYSKALETYREKLGLLGAKRGELIWVLEHVADDKTLTDPSRNNNEVKIRNYDDIFAF